MKTVLITGANRGIGLELTKAYLSKGWEVHATYRNRQDSSELLTLADNSDALICYSLDITEFSSLDKLVNQLPALELLISNAGYYGPKGYGFGHTDLDEWRRVFEVNTIAPLKLMELLYPKLKNGHDKKAVFLSSKVGSMTENTSGGGYIYRSSKAALNSVVKSLSNDLNKEGFICTALHPGWVLTEMGGPNALISTKESADGLYQVIDGLEATDSGRFLNYDGTEIPW